MADPRNCRHENIHWEDFFKPEKQNTYKYHHQKAYCIDCGADKGEKVAKAIQRWYCNKIDEWLKSQGMERGGYDPNWLMLLKNNNYYEDWWIKAQSRGIDPDYFEGLFGQSDFFEFARNIEYFCQELIKEKNKPNENPNDNDNQQIQKKNKIKRLKRIIKNLENKSNRTPSEDQELTTKKAQLAQLENEQNNNTNNNSWLQPTLIIGGSIIVIGLIWWATAKKNNKKH